MTTIAPTQADPLEITIYAFRNSSDLQHQTYSYDVIEPKDIQLVSSVNIVTSGTTGQVSSTFTRGTNSNHTLLTINGMPIKDHSTPTGVDDIGQHNIASMDQLEIIKGPMGSVYGPNAIGGVINMITYPNDENSITYSRGSNGLEHKIIKLGHTFNNQHTVDLRLSGESSDCVENIP